MKTAFFDQFDDLPASIQRLLDAAEKRSVFLGRDWFELLASQIIGPNQRLRLACVLPDSSDESPVLLPLIESGGRSIFSRVAIQGLANYYTPIFGPLIELNAPTAAVALQYLASFLRTSRPAPTRLALAPLDDNRSAVHPFCEALARTGWWVQSYFCFGNWYLPCDGLDPHRFLAERPPELRNTLQRKMRKFMRTPGAHIEIYTGPDGLEEKISAFNKVYERSWKNPEPYADFIPALIRLSARRGWLRLGVAWIDKVPAAAQLWIVANGVASIYKLAHDNAYSGYSAGSLLTAKLIENALLNEHVREIDYLTGDDAYKANWMTHRRERWGLAAYNPRTAAGWTTGALSLAGAQLKRRFSTSAD